jgi:hypothetical protein
MDSKIEQVLVSATSAAIAWLIDKAKHKDTKIDAKELEAAAIAAAQAAVQRAALELELRGFQVATDVLALEAQKLLEAIRAPSSLPNLLDGADSAGDAGRLAPRGTVAARLRRHPDQAG